MRNEYFVNEAKTIGDKKFASVPIAQMRIDHGYQRTLKSRVTRLIKWWDYEKCDVLIVSFRDDLFYVVDGQHRYEAAKANGVEYLPCQIVEGLSRQDEAKKFVSQNTEVSKLTPYDTFNANILMGDAIDIAISEMCKEYGFVIMPTYTQCASRLGSLADARKIIRMHGADCLRWILATLKAAGWSTKINGCSQMIMNALKNIWIISKMNRSGYMTATVRYLRTTTPAKLRSDATAKFQDREATSAVAMHLSHEVSKMLNSTYEKSGQVVGFK